MAVVTNVAEDHLGLRGVHTLDDLARVKGVVAASTGRRGATVLNADDPRCVRMADQARGRVIYFSLSPDNPVVERHVRGHGLALHLRTGPSGEVLALTDRREISLLNVNDIPATFDGRARVNIANALAAAAACIGLEIDLECIRQGLRSFTSSFFQTLGRLNLVDLPNGRVLLDYCHNPAGMEALADFIGRLAPASSVATIAIPGDRRDEDITAFARIAGRTFDEIILSESERRGRAPGTVAALMHAALLDVGMDPARVTVEIDPLDALEATLDRIRPDRLGVVLVDDPTTAYAALRARAGAGRVASGVA